jgi:hypothetical protein
LAYAAGGSPPMTIFMVSPRMQPALVPKPEQPAPALIEPQPIQPTPAQGAVPRPRAELLPPTQEPVAETGANELLLDWRHTQVRCEAGHWILANAERVLADFGGDECAARDAFTTAGMYRFTEKIEIGNPAIFHTYLVNGKAPRPLMYGAAASGVYFHRETLAVRPLGRIWAIADGEKPIFSFVQESDARSVLDLIQRLQADKLCRIGGAETGGLTFFVRTR